MSTRRQMIAPPEPSRYQRILASANGIPLARRFRDAVSETRRSLDPGSEHELAIREVSAGVAAPMLVSYVLWLLLDARQRGLKRLYFLTRDGQILLDIARRLAAKRDFGLELRYLHASRQAWNRATANPGTQSWVWDDVPPGATLDHFFKRLGVSAEEGRTALAAAGGEVPEGPLDAERIRELRALFRDPDFSRGIAAARSRQRGLVRDYLRDEGLFDGVPKAIVDIGWIGTLHETLCEFTAESGTEPVNGYFYGLKPFASPNGHLRHAFHFEARDGKRPDMLLPGIGLLVISEIFCAADHGTVAGFRRGEDGRVETEFASGWAHQVEAWGLATHRAVIAAVADRLDIRGLDAAAPLTMREPIRDLLRAFWCSPARAEAASWGSFPWDAGQGTERAVAPLAEPYGLRDLPGILRPKRLQKRHVFWIEGASALSPPPMRWALTKLTPAVETLRGRVRSLSRSARPAGGSDPAAEIPMPALAPSAQAPDGVPGAAASTAREAPVVGFDVFDTLLTRTVSPPEAVFRKVALDLRSRGLSPVGPDTYLRERKAAEQRCLRITGVKTNLQDICRELADALGLPAARAKDLAETEFHTEGELLIPVPEGVRRLREARAAGSRVVFISDMYLTRDMVANLLRRHAILEEGDELFVSCEAGADKRSGKLFHLVITQLSINPADFVFHGNSRRADIHGARGAGLRTVHLAAANSNRYEQILERAGATSEGLGYAFAGAAKRARLTTPPGMAGAAAAGAGIAAPLIGAHLLWILQKTRELGLTRLRVAGTHRIPCAELLVRLARRVATDIDCRALDGPDDLARETSDRSALGVVMPMGDPDPPDLPAGDGNPPNLHVLRWIDPEQNPTAHTFFRDLPVPAVPSRSAFRMLIGRLARAGYGAGDEVDCRAVVETFLDSLDDPETFRVPAKLIRSAIHESLTMFWTEPDEAEAAVWNDADGPAWPAAELWRGPAWRRRLHLVHKEARRLGVRLIGRTRRGLSRAWRNKLALPHQPTSL